MRRMELEKRFWDLCNAVEDLAKNDADVPDLEPSLLELLQFIKDHPDSRQLFGSLFSQIASLEKRYTAWIVLFCMRELRYPEVQEAANDHFENAGGRKGAPRLMNYISDINWAYDDSPWESADFFRYHWEREHPGEPWPCGNCNA